MAMRGVSEMEDKERAYEINISNGTDLLEGLIVAAERHAVGALRSNLEAELIRQTLEQSQGGPQ
jgi:hypothetical protein